MASTLPEASARSSTSDAVWSNLKAAIATSSGFERWKSELPQSAVETTPLDALVRRYLKETLETLAY